MKKNNHITINLSDDEYNALLFLSKQDRRKLAEYVYLLVVDELLKRIPKAASISDGEFEKMIFNNK